MIGKSIKTKTKKNQTKNTPKKQKKNPKKEKFLAFKTALAAKKQVCCQKKFEKGWEVALYFSALIHFSQRMSFCFLLNQEFKRLISSYRSQIKNWGPELFRWVILMFFLDRSINRKSFYQTILVTTSFTCCRWYVISMVSCLHFESEFLLKLQFFSLHFEDNHILSSPYNCFFS